MKGEKCISLFVMRHVCLLQALNTPLIMAQSLPILVWIAWIKCDQSIKYVLDKNSDMINLISAGYLNRELKNFEKLFQRSYFNSYRGKTVNLPMRAVFNINDSNVDNEDKLNKLISDVKMTENSNGEKIIDSVDVFDEQKFKYYKSLVPMILGSAFMVFLFALLIPFFIVSNTIRLIIPFKKTYSFNVKIIGRRTYI